MPPTRHLILFMLDGLRPDALPRSPTPTIDALVDQGAYTWQAQTVRPSVTLPCHASMMYGVLPSRHGIVSNDWTPIRPPLSGLFEVAHRAGLETAAFYCWEPLRDLFPLGILDTACYRRMGEPAGEIDREIGTVAAAHIARRQPALSFVYLNALDAAGHRYGWMSAEYLQAVTEADQTVGLVLDAVRAAGNLAQTTCLMLADHGGHELNHEEGVAADLTIPWILSGPGVRRGQAIARPVHICDTAPTAAHLLGLAAPSEWTGQAIVEALLLGSDLIP
jgi:predicted AlkP superfamily pyrophosphatase or phosphodiesterase